MLDFKRYLSVAALVLIASAQAQVPPPPPPGSDSAPAAPSSGGGGGDIIRENPYGSDGEDDYFASDAAKDDTPMLTNGEGKTVDAKAAEKAAKVRVDCSQPPKVMLKIQMCSNQQSISNSQMESENNSTKAKVEKQLEKYAVKDSPELSQARANLATLARKHIGSVAPKINSMLSLYCGMGKLTDKIIEENVDPVRIVFIPENQFNSAMSQMFGGSDWKGTMGFYDSASDHLIVRAGAPALTNTVVMAHEFMHRILWRSYRMNFGWHHAFIEGDPKNGLLGWAVDQSKETMGGTCTPVDCKGFRRCWTNWSAERADADASILAETDPVPIQMTHEQMLANAQADKKRKDDAKLNGEIDAMMSQMNAQKGGPSAVDGALKRSNEPPPDLSGAYKAAQDPNSYNNADPSKQGMTGGGGPGYIPPPGSK